MGRKKGRPALTPEERKRAEIRWNLKRKKFLENKKFLEDKKRFESLNRSAENIGIYWVDEGDRFTIYSMRTGAIIATWWKARSALVLATGTRAIPCDFGKAIQMLKRGGSAEDGIVRRPLQ